MTGLAEASTEFYRAHILGATSPSAAAAPTPALGVRRADDKRSTEKQSLTSYHWQLFQVLLPLMLCICRCLFHWLELGDMMVFGHLLIA